MRHHRSGTLAAACLVGLGVAAGCTRNDTTVPAGDVTGSPPGAAGQPAPGQSVAIAFRSDPDPPESGDNMFEVIVTLPDGSPVTDAAVTAVFSMPAMPSMNMPAMRSTSTLAHAGSGRYRGTGQLSMSGTWNVTVTVARGSEELGSRRLSVIAK